MFYDSFSVVKCSISGELGFLRDGCDNGYIRASFDPYTLTHDLIEHVNGAEPMGGIEDEIEAIGAAWFTRGQWGNYQINFRIDPLQGLKNDIALIIEEIVNLSEEDDLFLLSECSNNYIDKWEGFAADCEPLLIESLENYNDELSEEQKENIINEFTKWFCSGIEKISQRYDDDTGITCNNVFYQVREAINALISENNFYERQEFTIYYDADSCEIIDNEQQEIEEKTHV